MIQDCSLKIPYLYLWIPERTGKLDMAKVDYNGPEPLRVWSLHRFTDPNVMPTFKELPMRETDLTLEFPGTDYLYIRNQGRFYYRGRFHRGNHWLRLDLLP